MRNRRNAGKRNRRGRTRGRRKSEMGSREELGWRKKDRERCRMGDEGNGRRVQEEGMEGR